MFTACPSARAIEVYALRENAYALTQRTGRGDVVASLVLPDLALRSDDVFP